MTENSKVDSPIMPGHVERVEEQLPKELQSGALPGLGRQYDHTGFGLR